LVAQGECARLANELNKSVKPAKGDILIFSFFVGSCVGSSLVTISDEEIDIALQHLAVGEMANHPYG